MYEHIIIYLTILSLLDTSLYYIQFFFLGNICVHTFLSPFWIIYLEQIPSLETARSKALPSCFPKRQFSVSRDIQVCWCHCPLIKLTYYNLCFCYFRWNIIVLVCISQITNEVEIYKPVAHAFVFQGFRIFLMMNTISSLRILFLSFIVKQFFIRFGHFFYLWF